MKNMRIFIPVLLALILSSAAILGTKTPNQILLGVYNKMNKVKDYSASARIKADIPMIKALPVNAKIYFKQKNKFKVESKSIVILPKQGMNDFSTTISDTNSYTAVLKGTEVLNKTSVKVINVIPNSDTADVILAKFWIDDINSLVMKSQLTTRSNGTVVVEYFYKDQKTYGLPDSMIFTVDVKKFKVPKGVAVDIQKTKTNTATAAKTGKIYVRIKEYSINKGIPDSKFK